MNVIEVLVRRWNEPSVKFKLTFYHIPFSEFMRNGGWYVTAALERRGLIGEFTADYSDAVNVTHSVERPIPYKRKPKEYTSADELKFIEAEKMMVIKRAREQARKY